MNEISEIVPLKTIFNKYVLVLFVIYVLYSIIGPLGILLLVYSIYHLLKSRSILPNVERIFNLLINTEVNNARDFCIILAMLSTQEPPV